MGDEEIHWGFPVSYQVEQILTWTWRTPFHSSPMPCLDAWSEDTQVVYGCCYHGFLSKHAGSLCFPMKDVIHHSYTHMPCAVSKDSMDLLHHGCLHQRGSAEHTMGRDPVLSPGLVIVEMSQLENGMGRTCRAQHGCTGRPIKPVCILK